MRKFNEGVTLKDYVRSLSSDDLRELGQRYSQKLYGDYCEIALALQKNRELDQWLKTATSSTEFFEMMDQVGDAITREQNKREREDVKV
jgi:hypothetical protein